MIEQEIKELIKESIEQIKTEAEYAISCITSHAESLTTENLESKIMLDEKEWWFFKKDIDDLNRRLSQIERTLDNIERKLT